MSSLFQPTTVSPVRSSTHVVYSFLRLAHRVGQSHAAFRPVFIIMVSLFQSSLVWSGPARTLCTVFVPSVTVDIGTVCHAIARSFWTSVHQSRIVHTRSLVYATPAFHD